MKKLYFLLFAFLTVAQVMAQKVALDPTITPTLFRPNDEITVTYDVTGTSLASLSNAYIWVWIPGKNTNAKYNVNPATSAIDAAKFAKTVGGKTTFSITFKPSDFFTTSITSETQLGILLKGPDWSNGQTSDYIATFWDGSFQLALTSPSQRPLFVSNGDEILISAETPVSANYKLYINDVLTNQQDNTTKFSYTHNVTETSGGAEVKIVATSGDNTSSTTFQYLISQQSPVVARPSGVIPGINYSNDPTKVTLCLLAPGKTSAYVRGDFTDWLFQPEYIMNKDGEYFWIEITGLTSGTEYGFQYLIDESIYIADPYADKILDPADSEIPVAVYSSLKSYPTEALNDNWYFNRVAVLQTNQPPYNWQIQNFEKPAKESLVIYEVLLRDFFEDGSRSYKSMTDTIKYLKRLGVNAVQLMPIMDFNDNKSWGYNPQFMFAPDKYYGTKNDFKKFVDECHKAGIAVILDIAMNHQNLANPYVMLDFNFETMQVNPTNKWFNVEATHPYSVFYDMNHESLYTKAYLDTINYYWLHEYKVDGFRYDLSKGFTQKVSGGDVGAWSNYDASRIAILKRMADKIWSHTPDAIVILEHFAANDEEKELAEYRAGEGKGMMLWGNLNYAFNQLTMGFGEDADVSWLDYGQRGWSTPHVVGYMESHDEERLAYKNKTFGAEKGAYSTKSIGNSMDRIKAAEVIFYTVPGPKMLWEFGELGFDYSINTCQDGTVSNDCRLSEKPVVWDYKTDKDRAGLFEHTSDLIKLHTQYSVFANGDATVSSGSSLIKQVTLKNTPYTATPASTDQMNVQAVANFDLSKQTIQVTFPHAGTWYDYYANGEAINVAAVPYSVTLYPGTFKLYTDVQIGAGPITVVEEVRGEHPLIVMPNPTTGSFKISELRKNVQYYLLDSRGIKQDVVKQDDAFDISQLSSGLYILVGTDPAGRKSVVKLIKQ